MPPPNDNLANAIEISYPTGEASGTTVDATAETAEIADGFDQPSVWYKFYATHDKLIRFKDVYGSYVLYGEVYSGPPNATSFDQLEYAGLYFGDGTTGPFTMESATQLNAGNWYYIYVGNWEWDGTSGTFHFQLQSVQEVTLFYDTMDTPWTQIGPNDLNVWPAERYGGFNLAPIGGHTSICKGPDGQPWIAWLWPEVVGIAGYSAGPYVKRWNGSSWVLVPGSQPDGGVSEKSQILTRRRSDLPPIYVSEATSTNPQIQSDGTYVYIVDTQVLQSDLDAIPYKGSRFVLRIWRWNGTNWAASSLRYHATSPIGGTNFTNAGVRRPLIVASPKHPGRCFVIRYEDSGDGNGNVTWRRVYMESWNGSTWTSHGYHSLSSSTETSGLHDYDISVLENGDPLWAILKVQGGANGDEVFIYRGTSSTLTVHEVVDDIFDGFLLFPTFVEGVALSESFTPSNEPGERVQVFFSSSFEAWTAEYMVATDTLRHFQNSIAASSGGARFAGPMAPDDQRSKAWITRGPSVTHYDESCRGWEEIVGGRDTDIGGGSNPGFEGAGPYASYRDGDFIYYFDSVTGSVYRTNLCQCEGNSDNQGGYLTPAPNAVRTILDDTAAGADLSAAPVGSQYTIGYSVRTNQAWNGSSPGTPGGSPWIINGIDFGLQTQDIQVGRRFTWRIRARVEGPGTADIGIYIGPNDSSVFNANCEYLGYVRISNTSYQLFDLATYTTTSAKRRVGIKAGVVTADAVHLDYLEQRLDTTQSGSVEWKREYRVYRGHICRECGACPPIYIPEGVGPIDLSRIRLRAYQLGDV